MRHSTLRAIATVRTFAHWQRRPGLLAKAARKVIRLRHMWWSWVSGTDIALGARIGERLDLPHANGVVIHQDAVVGDDCMIMQQVTLGQLSRRGAPILEEGVYVGAGAKVLGSIRIGARAQIGANAVVLKDVPAGATAVGIPARIV